MDTDINGFCTLTKVIYNKNSNLLNNYIIIPEFNFKDFVFPVYYYLASVPPAFVSSMNYSHKPNPAGLLSRNDCN